MARGFPLFRLLLAVQLLSAIAGCKQLSGHTPRLPWREQSSGPTPLLVPGDSDDSLDVGPLLPPSPAADASDSEIGQPVPASGEATPEDVETYDRATPTGGISVPRPQPADIEPEGPVAVLDVHPRLDVAQFVADLTAGPPSRLPRSHSPTITPAVRPVVRAQNGIEDWPRDGVPASVIITPGPSVGPIPRLHHKSDLRR